MFHAISDPARMEIIYLLGRRGRMNVGDIASQFRQSRPAISHHLKVLKEAEVVQSEKLGQEIFYWVDRTYLASALRSMADAVESCCPPDQAP